jgi:hypothetical protein
MLEPNDLAAPRTAVRQHERFVVRGVFQLFAVLPANLAGTAVVFVFVAARLITGVADSP